MRVLFDPSSGAAAIEHATPEAESESHPLRHLTSVKRMERSSGLNKGLPSCVNPPKLICQYPVTTSRGVFGQEAIQAVCEFLFVALTISGGTTTHIDGA